jgi:phage terminase large subunit
MELSVESKITLNKFLPRWYQLPLLDSIEKKQYTKVVAILPRRAGKDVACWNLMVRSAIRRPGVYWYILPTYAQGKK